MGMSDYSVRDALNVQLGQHGRLTITDTTPHYGRYARVFFLADTVFTAITDELGNLANGFAFLSGGTAEVKVGNVLLGATSGAAVRVRAITLSSGSWAGGSAAGWIEVENINGTALTASETMNLARQGPTAPGEDPVFVSVTTNVLTVESAANGGPTAGDTQVGETYPAGSEIQGAFTKLHLASGACEAYKA